LNLILDDDNHISIDGDTALGFTENVTQRFEACGWHTQEIENGDDDLESIIKAIEVAKSIENKPSVIKIRCIDFI
jgi:transketolase